MHLTIVSSLRAIAKFHILLRLIRYFKPDSQDASLHKLTKPRIAIIDGDLLMSDVRPNTPRRNVFEK
jgi:hypothetical protein